MLLEAKVFSFFQFIFFCGSFEDWRCTYEQISERNSAVWGWALLIFPVHFSRESFKGVHINRIARGTCFQGLSSMNLYSYMWWSENSVPWPLSERVLHNVLDGWKMYSIHGYYCYAPQCFHWLCLLAPSCFFVCFLQIFYSKPCPSLYHKTRVDPRRWSRFAYISAIWVVMSVEDGTKL